MVLIMFELILAIPQEVQIILLLGLLLVIREMLK